jgi:hypothetical protein
VPSLPIAERSGKRSSWAHLYAAPNLAPVAPSPWCASADASSLEAVANADGAVGACRRR